MYLAIDGRRLIRQPHSIEIVLPEEQVAQTADQRTLVLPGGEYATLNCTWGREMTYEKVLAELHRVRANQGVHAVTFEPMRGCRYLTVNAWMGRPREAHIGHTHDGKIVSSAFTIPFHQVDPAVALFLLTWRLRGILAVMDAACSHPAPAAGRIVAVDGFIGDLGAGAGQTRVQISNGAVDYLSTPGDFVCAPPERQMQNQVLAAGTDFAQGDQIDVDVDTIPAGGLSNNAMVWAWCLMCRP